MRITFWGVRGSIPTPGPEYTRYGGNTPCVSVQTEAGTWIILDAGTGAIVLGKELMKTDFAEGKGKATLLLSHTHWDHIQGFPFFVPIFIPGNKFTLFGPSESSSMLESILEGQMDPHFSPIQSLRNLGASIDVQAIQEGQSIVIDDLRIRAGINPHGRSTALAYELTSVSSGNKKCIYAPDVMYTPGEPRHIIQNLYQDATVLIHDCTYTPEMQAIRRSRGNSSITDAARVAARSKVEKMIMFHYNEEYTDQDVDVLYRSCREFLDQEPGGDGVELIAAFEGLTITI